MTSLGFRPNLDGYWDASLDLQRQVIARTEAELARHRELEDADTPERLHAYQESVRADVVAGIGGLVPMPPGPPVIARRGTLAASGYTVQRLVYESLPQVPVPALLYRPSLVPDGGAPAVLFVSGHAPLAKAHAEYQRVCAALAAAGMVVLAIDPWGQGERLGYLGGDGSPLVPGGTAEHSYTGLQAWAWGESAAKYFVHDARRGIDLLAALPEVDEARIGITGNSGGGMLSALMAAVEPRLAAAAIGTFVTSRGAYLRSGQRQDAEQVLLGGTAAGVDHADLLAAMAPRPVVVLAAEYDFFPIEGTLASMARARRAFAVAGAESALEFVRAPVTHRYAPELAAAAVDFFTRALVGADTRLAPVGEVFVAFTPETDENLTHEHAVFTAEELRCTISGQVALDEPGAKFLHDLVLDGASNLGNLGGLGGVSGVSGKSGDISVAYGAESDENLTHRDADRDADGDRDSAGSAAWLAEQVNAGRRPTTPRPRWLPGPEGVRHGFWRVEEDLWGAGVLLQPRTGEPAQAPRSVTVHLVLHPEGTATLTEEAAALLKQSGTVSPADLVLVLDVRGLGALAAHDKDGLPPTDQASALYKLACDLLWLGDSLAAARLHDVRSAVDMIVADPQLRTELPGLDETSPVELHGHGVLAYAAMAAGVLDDRVRRVHTYGDTGSIEALLTERHYERSDGAWQWVIPGMATHAAPNQLATALGDRMHIH